MLDQIEELPVPGAGLEDWSRRYYASYAEHGELLSMWPEAYEAGVGTGSMVERAVSIALRHRSLRCYLRLQPELLHRTMTARTAILVVTLGTGQAETVNVLLVAKNDVGAGSGRLGLGLVSKRMHNAVRPYYPNRCVWRP